MGILLEIEATAIPHDSLNGKVTVTGIIDEEETGTYERKFRRKSTSRGSVDNVLTVIRKYLDVDPRKYDIHINFPGGIPIDGPSAGIAITTAIYSAITNKAVDNTIAMTGEISIRGFVKPIGGVVAKIEAAKRAGVKKVIIPKENYQDRFKDMEIEIIPVTRIEEVIELALIKEDKKTIITNITPEANIGILSAKGVK